MLIMLCGPSFCGKSTLAEQLRQQHGFVVVSLDEINARRGLWGGDGIAQQEWARTHHIALEELATALQAGQSVVVDDTCCFRFLRDSYREVAVRQGASHRLWVINPPVELLQQRRQANQQSRQRPGISDTVFEQHLATFEWPTEDEQPLSLDPHKLADAEYLLDLHPA